MVSSLLILNHLPQGGRVRPTAEEMRSLLRALRVRDEKLIAQIHTHEGLAFHSYGDDTRATSYHPGFISIVVPRFGRAVHAIDECAVYEFRGTFEPLTRREITDRFCICEDVVELAPLREWEEKPSIWNALSRKLKSIVRRKR